MEDLFYKPEGTTRLQEREGKEVGNEEEVHGEDEPPTQLQGVGVHSPVEGGLQGPLRTSSPLLVGPVDRRSIALRRSSSVSSLPGGPFGGDPIE